MPTLSSLRVYVCALTLGACLVGCGPSATVTGKVTCSGKPVVGALLLTPTGKARGESVQAILNADGSFSASLNTIGPHRVVIMPSDVPYPAPPGKEYPCDLGPLSKDLVAGANEMIIELPPKK